jgi:hypothetical protein
VPSSQEMTKLIHHTEWVKGIIRTTGGCTVTEAQVTTGILPSMPSQGAFEYQDPNGDNVKVTIQVLNAT